MSSRQGGSKDLEELERDRAKAREITQKKRDEEDKRKKELEDKRLQAKSKVDEVIKSKAPRKPFLTLTKYQITFISVIAIMLFLGVLNFVGGEGSASDNVIDDLTIEKVNKENRGYKVGANEFFEGWSLSDARSHLYGIQNSGGFPTCGELQIENLPKKFSTRQKHVSCLTPIHDQGKCSASYAHAVTGMMTNRYCIANDGNRKFDVSPQHIISCQSKTRCSGGDLAASARAAQSAGVVNTVCLPYNTERADACDADKLKPCFTLHLASVCTTAEVEQIKRHIYKNGPVASLLQATNELLVYSSGIYDATKGTLRSPATPFTGAQAVKIVGWDTDAKNEQFWVVENSWGSSWGIGGLAKVKIGTDPLLEKSVIVGMVEKEIRAPVAA